MYCLLPVGSSDLDHGVLFRDMEEQSGENDLHMQCLDPASILGRRHLDTAFVNAVANFSSGKNLTRSFPVELVLMLSGQRQIKEAFTIYGISGDADSFLMFSCSKEAVDAAVRDFSIERWADHGRKFESDFRDDVMTRTRELITTLGLTVPENEPKDLFSPVGSKIAEAFALAGIPWPEGGMRDLRKMEKAMCEKINLIHCR